MSVIQFIKKKSHQHKLKTVFLYLYKGVFIVSKYTFTIHQYKKFTLYPLFLHIIPGVDLFLPMYKNDRRWYQQLINYKKHEM